MEEFVNTDYSDVLMNLYILIHIYITILRWF